MVIVANKISVLRGETMTDEYFCRPKENLHCFYITKDNVEEFVDKYGYNEEHTITMNERCAYVKYKYDTWIITLNTFIVYEYDGWTSYTKEEFDEIYEITI